MSSAIRPAIAPFGWSIALHAALAGLLYFGLQLPRPDAPVMPLPIEAVIVDQVVLQAASRQRRSDERRQAEERRREEAVAATERVAQEQAARAEAAAEEEAEANRRAAADAKRKAEQQAAAKAAADRKRAADEARLRQQREADLRERLEAEEERTSAGFQDLKASYILAIQSHVELRWFEPPGTGPGLSCTVLVSQIPGGEVVGMRFGACNGNPAVRESIETAVRKASPLPAPPEPALFEREVQLIFTPKESRR